MFSPSRNASRLRASFRLKQTASIATMDLGASDHALAQFIRGRFIWTFRSGDFNFDIYTDRDLL